MNINALVMKEINIHLVRTVLKTKVEATKHEIAQATGLSSVTVGTILKKLMENNEVFDAGLADSMGGRPAQLFRFNENHAHILVLFTHERNGLDILYVRVANLIGDCIYEHETSLSDIDLHTFEPYIADALEDYPTIQAIGFGLPGVELDGKIEWMDYQALGGTEFVAHYHERYQLPVMVENDVNAAIVGYCKRNEIEETATLYLYFPGKYPPGGGIQINDELFKRYRNYAGEIAAMPLDIDWQDPALYTSPERINAAIAKVIAAISMLLNPESVVLFGTFLSDDHLSVIRQHCVERLPFNSIPYVYLASNFTLDYQQGMIEETLALLSPQISISL